MIAGDLKTVDDIPVSMSTEFVDVKSISTYKNRYAHSYQSLQGMKRFINPRTIGVFIVFLAIGLMSGLIIYAYQKPARFSFQGFWLTFITVWTLCVGFLQGFLSWKWHPCNVDMDEIEENAMKFEETVDVFVTHYKEELEVL